MSESLQEWLALLFVGITISLIILRWFKVRINQSSSTSAGCNNCGSNSSCQAGSDKEVTSTQAENVIPIKLVKQHDE